MSVGTVVIDKVNMNQGEGTDVDRVMLFVGTGAGTAEGSILSVGTATDLDAALGPDSSLKTMVSAARDQAGQGWRAYVLPLEEGVTWQDGVDFAMERVNVEGIALTDPISSVADVENMQTKGQNIMSRYVRPLFMVGRAPAITQEQTFAQYREILRPITQNVAADQVTLVPTIWGPELGAYCGRLCASNVSVADSPMRVASGALVGNWTERPVDAAGNILDMAEVAAIHDLRFSMPQWYPSYEGVYWTDGTVLDVQTGDYTVIENLRVIHKCMRKVYPLAVAKIADRALNQTPKSIAKHKSYFLRPLRAMSKSFMLLGQEFPGDILPPSEDDISLTWMSRTLLNIAMAAQPYNSPKKIVVNLALDLTGWEALAA